MKDDINAIGVLRGLANAIIKWRTEAAAGVPAFSPVNDALKLADAVLMTAQQANIPPYHVQNGFVLANGNKTKFRAIGVDGIPYWTENKNEALQLHRRGDADAWCESDEAISYVLSVSSV